MRVRLLSGADEFLAATLGLRAADPVLTNVLGSVATGVAAGIHYDTESFFVVESDGVAVGAALWTVPFRLLVGPMGDDAAAAVGAAAAQRAAGDRYAADGGRRSGPGGGAGRGRRGAAVARHEGGAGARARTTTCHRAAWPAAHAARATATPRSCAGGGTSSRPRSGLRPR